MTDSETEALADAVRRGERRALSRAITLVESGRPSDRTQAIRLIDLVLPATGSSLRLAVSGTPGVGKSTFIEAFGLMALERGHRVAVLSIDPTSARSGGSIMGDKTRMPELSRAPGAFIRPSPSGGMLGGVAQQTREALLLCEAAGHDLVLVETVGVGQSETAAADLTDLFLLLLAPGGGDDLQGIKRGIMELADVVAVNKSDGDLAALAAHAVADHRSALQLLRPKWPGHPTSVLAISSVHGTGLEELYHTLHDRHASLEREGSVGRQREQQARRALHAEIERALRARLFADPSVATALSSLEDDVAAGRRAAGSAAQVFLDRIDR